MIAAEVRLSALICTPNHGSAVRIASAAHASATANTTAMPAMADHDVSGGIQDASQVGTEGLNEASSANQANRETKPLMTSGPIASELEPDTYRPQRSFDARAVSEEEEGADVERNAGLDEQGDDAEQHRVAEGIAENVFPAHAGWSCRRRGLSLRSRSGARNVLEHSGAAFRGILSSATYPRRRRRRRRGGA
ncbi:hypothetical protein ACQ86E_30250 [Bradyrhizobium betae]|uniref:hypothetical protein n=1 Tax=Bradyrhizobium betae TaxID=244734 RepID=UPI003D66E214